MKGKWLSFKGGHMYRKNLTRLILFFIGVLAVANACTLMPPMPEKVSEVKGTQETSIISTKQNPLPVETGAQQMRPELELKMELAASKLDHVPQSFKLNTAQGQRHLLAVIDAQQLVLAYQKDASFHRLVLYDRETQEERLLFQAQEEGVPAMITWHGFSGTRALISCNDSAGKRQVYLLDLQGEKTPLQVPENFLGSSMHISSQGLYSHENALEASPLHLYPFDEEGWKLAEEKESIPEVLNCYEAGGQVIYSLQEGKERIFHLDDGRSARIALQAKDGAYLLPQEDAFFLVQISADTGLMQLFELAFDGESLEKKALLLKNGNVIFFNEMLSDDTRLLLQIEEGDYLLYQEGRWHSIKAEDLRTKPSFDTFIIKFLPEGKFMVQAGKNTAYGALIFDNDAELLIVEPSLSP